MEDLVEDVEVCGYYIFASHLPTMSMRACNVFWNMAENVRKLPTCDWWGRSRVTRCPQMSCVVAELKHRESKCHCWETQVPAMCPQTWWNYCTICLHATRYAAIKWIRKCRQRYAMRLNSEESLQWTYMWMFDAGRLKWQYIRPVKLPVELKSATGDEHSTKKETEKMLQYCR